MSNAQLAATSYDEVPYPSTSHVFTHPDNLATAARVLGLTPAPLDQCRVLELGCAGGGNLIPMALSLPNATFVGVDASAVQIADGQAAIAAVGARNVTLHCLDILDITPDFGQFDYIITHGIFSWVPEAVRDQILSISRRNLSPQGLAYISYNTYPGWNILGTVRQMMLYRTRHASDARARIAQAREMLDFVTRSLAAASERNPGKLVKAYAGFLQSESEHIRDSSDSYVFHEELEEINAPIYFNEFAAWAARHQLQYLCEANFSDVFLNDFPPEVTSELLKLAHDLIELEQYMDFLRNRTFRKTLLVPDTVPISRQLRPERVRQLFAATNARSASAAPDIRSISVEEFASPDGLKFATDHPLTKAALLHLADLWPQALAFDELVDAAYARLGAAPVNHAARAQDEQLLCANLLKGYAYSGRLIELHTRAPRFSAVVSERPVASPWARYQAQTSGEVTNLCHVRVELKGIAQYLLSHLDGTHDRAALLAGLERSVADGTLILHSDATEPPLQSQPVLAEELDEALRGLARVALLQA